MAEWKRIRLQLARTEEFPDGSASRSYIIRLPLNTGGMIDEAARALEPARARVRRFWPNEPDLSGYVISTGEGWAFSYQIGEDDDEKIFHLESHPIREGEYITLTEPDGKKLPFRVTEVRPN